jgi:hypothetical protein
MSEEPAEVGRTTLVAGMVLLAACAAASALLETMLVPLRWGTVIVPLAVPLAVLSNVALPTLAWRIRAVPALAVVPVVAWLIVVVLLSESRREGDVLLPGGNTGVKYVAYGYLLAGFATGLVTLLVLTGRFTRAERR